MSRSMIRWEPFREMVSLRQAMDRLFEDSFVRPPSFWPELKRDEPQIDMYKTDKDVVVKAALPGVKPEEVDITIDGDTLTIKGEHKQEEEIKKENYFYKEHRYGTFNRSVILPAGLNTDKAKASFSNGILALTIPMSEETKPKQIKIEVKDTAEDKK